MLKKSVSIALLSSLTLMSVELARPLQAHAGIGVLLRNKPVKIVGLSFMGLGTVGFGTAVTRDCTDLGCGIGWAVIGVYSVGAAALGLLILEDQPNGFGPMAATTAQRIGLTAAEHTAYMDELDEINAVHQEVLTDLSAARPSRVNVPHARDLWSKYGAALSPEAFSAAQKIANEAIRDAEKRSRPRPRR